MSGPMVSGCTTLTDGADSIPRALKKSAQAKLGYAAIKALKVVGL